MLLRETARIVGGVLGRQSPVIRALRPAYDTLLEWSSGAQGMAQVLNSHERFRIDPRHRKYFPDVHDPSVHSYLRERVAPGAVCLNIGAHIGIYTLCLAEWSGPSGHVYAFEPNPSASNVLRKHVVLNDFIGRVSIVPSAVSDRSGHTKFFVAESRNDAVSGLSRLGQPNSLAEDVSGRMITVPVTTVDEFCRVHKITPDWIVMDIEGFELSALNGSVETISKTFGRLGLIVEMHPGLWASAGASRSALEEWLTAIGLRAIGLTGQIHPLGSHGIVCLVPS